MTTPHASSCALHNAPPSEPGPCDCEATDILERIEHPETRHTIPLAVAQLLAECAITIRAYRAERNDLAEGLAYQESLIPKEEVARLYGEIECLGRLNNNLIVALIRAIEVAGEAQQEWDKAPNGMRDGKILIALAGGCKGYRADTDQIHETLAVAISQMKDQPPIAKSEAVP